MYLFRLFDSFLPLRNPIGFGASDFIVLALACLLVIALVAKTLIEPYARQLAPRTVPCMFLIFGVTVSLRLLLLQQHPIPAPSGADDFSYILLGDTLRHLRLANPAHPLHQFFEAVFVLQQPTYSSIYPPGQGLPLALGKIVLSSFWAGVLVSGGIFCAACYWMLRGWITPNLSLAGGLLACIEFGPLNPWMNSYWGGYLSGIAGCLVFGSLPRLCRKPRLRYALLLGSGMALQIITRPFEAIFLALTIAVYLIIWFRGGWIPVRRLTVSSAAIVAMALGLTAFQNRAVTHSWTTLPYMLSRYQYGVPTTFTFQPNPVPHQPLTPEQDLDYRAQAAIHGPGTDSVASYLERLTYRFRYVPFFLMPPLYLALLAFVPRLRERRYLWATGTIAVFALGTNFYSYFFPHYVAAITCIFLLLALAGMERLSKTASLYTWLLCFASFLFWFGIALFRTTADLPVNDYQSWHFINGNDPQGRVSVQRKLLLSPGNQLVFVHYSAFHRFQEWIHNDADIDTSKIVWANDLGTEENEKLILYYPHRKLWLLEPDARPISLVPYPESSGIFESVH